jgi:squalene-hopene/tetraprenyl-beta-curcumene cyclase
VYDETASDFFLGPFMRFSLLFIFVVSPAFAETPKPTPTTANEPFAKSFSIAKAADYIDAVSLNWTRERKCFSCHTNVPYMLARPAPLKELRLFLENEAAGWEKTAPKTDYYVLTTAFALAGHDAATTGKLQPLTKKALDWSMKLQKEDGSWKWPKCDWPPLEHDTWYGVVFMAIAYGTAPENYAKSEHVKPTLDRIRAYIAKNPPPDLHHKASLLWASQKIDGLTTDDERRATIKELLAKQRQDGGWCLPSLGDYGKRRDGSLNDPNSPSDGYATGFVVYVLRQASVKTDDPALQKAVKWLKSNQRESGLWFTRSLRVDHTDDRAHLITHAGSAFCVLALHACGESLKD